MNKLLFCDTCVLIDFINEQNLILGDLQNRGFILFINSIIEMELLYGAHNQRELKKIQQKLSLFRRLKMDQDILDYATSLLNQYTLSHRLNPADALIAATTITYHLDFFTYNTKDFKYFPTIQLWQPELFSAPPKQTDPPGKVREEKHEET